MSATGLISIIRKEMFMADLKEIVKKEYVENDETLCFESTPIQKCIILLLVSCGFYSVFIFYSYWKRLRDNFGYKVSPFWRGLFAGFTNFSLFPVLDKYFRAHNIKSFNPTVLAGAFLIFCYVSNKVSYKSMSFESINPAYELIYWIFTLLFIGIIVLVQTKINNINSAYYPNAPKNDWKLSNTIWTIVLAIIMFLSYLPV